MMLIWSKKPPKFYSVENPPLLRAVDALSEYGPKGGIISNIITGIFAVGIIGTFVLLAVVFVGEDVEKGEAMRHYRARQAAQPTYAELCYGKADPNWFDCFMADRKVSK